ncbi:Putative disease resistance protein RGA3 [Linum perenne]
MAAETILLPVAKQILGKLGKLATEQIGLIWTLKREVLKLKATLSTIQAVLLDAEEKQTHNRHVKDWLEKLSDVMYDADDLLDDFSSEACRQAMAEADDSRRTRSPKSTTCWSMKQLIHGLKVAHDIKAIREKLNDIAKDKDNLHLEVRSDEAALPLALALRESSSCPPITVVGREDDKNSIVKLLLNSNSEANISVVPIVGMGGLGKTTLAQLVFDDKRVQDYFVISFWVYVSQIFNIKVILGKMLQSITCKREADLDLVQLQGKLHKELTGNRFLFALDDVWEENDQSWETLANYLAVGAPGSKVLVTTRSAKVAEVCGRIIKSLLKGLSLDESWDLLVRKAHPRQVPQDPHLKKVGQEILGRCCGVPLAVSTIAGVLISSKHPEIEWPSFLQKRLLDTSNDAVPIMTTLQLSFNHLPSKLKRCFAYCKLYPKGHKFNVQRLVHFWVAQGYIESEDEGVGCFKMLWWRSFFHEVKMDDFGNILTCRVHDLMQDFADSIAGGSILKISRLTDVKNIASNTRHLALSNGQYAYPSMEDELGNMNSVRTLLCYDYISRPECDRVFLNFKHLRVLMLLVDSEKNHHETNRCLSFLFGGMEGIPDSIINLLNLRVLGVISTSLTELPRDIRKLVNLKHLYFESGNLTHMPKGIGELKWLQTLPFFVVGKKSSSNEEMLGAGLDELKELNALRGQLVITNLVDVQSTGLGVNVLRGKLFLQSLVLDWGYTNNDCDITPSISDEKVLEILCPHPNLNKLEIVGGYRGAKIPNWLPTITNLVEFVLKDCRKCKYFPPLHQMPFLKKLIVVGCPQLKGINNNGGVDSSLENSTDEDLHRFQCLAHLFIRDCPMLTQIPTYPTVEGNLELIGTSLEPLARTMKMRSAGKGGVHYLDEHQATLVHPLSKLTTLMLSRINDTLQSLPDADFNSLSSLQELRLENCHRGVKVPSSLCSSTSLTMINISFCKTIEYLPPLHTLPSLVELYLSNCSELKGCWWKEKDDHVDCYYYYEQSSTSVATTPKKGETHEKEYEQNECWPHFTSLSTLKILKCPNLIQFPLFPTVQDLELQNTSSHALVRTMKMKLAAHLHGKYTAATTTCSSSSMQAALVTPLSKLTCLVLRDIDDLESLPEDGLRNLTSLQELDIRNCPRLASLPPAMRQLTSIQSLKLVNCPQLNDRFENREGEDWLNISHIPNIFVDELELAMEDGHFDDYFCPCCGSSIRRKVVLRRRRRMIEELMFF